MNFLAHSLISLEIDEQGNKKTLYGNFAGDFYKGLIDKIELPEELKEGIVLHRIIDGISDRNENFLNELLAEKFGIFKGIVSDMFIDHFLAQNFDRLFNENINNIEKKILYNISKNQNYYLKINQAQPLTVHQKIFYTFLFYIKKFFYRFFFKGTVIFFQLLYSHP